MRVALLPLILFALLLPAVPVDPRVNRTSEAPLNCAYPVDLMLNFSVGELSPESFNLNVRSGVLSVS